MPARAKRPYKHRGCILSTNNTSGYCDTHYQLHVGDRWRNYTAGKGRQERGYSRTWELRSARIPVRDKYLHQDCRRRGLGIKAEWSKQGKDQCIIF